MLKKNHRAGRKVIEEIFKFGRSFSSPGLSFKFIRKAGENRISFIVPKAIAKTAVKRNLLRRRGYAALRPLFPYLPQNLSGTFILKAKDISTEELKKEISAIISKLK